ncbi:Eco57I restriction-modification methylase [Flavobacterium anhuiense]|uniref:site-specific DNA-methyltransferase (adenine-specific) n=1 Tax=Flavobacterium anhuiense TaxID=459526 RepID=A0ABY0LQ85_9FLAO|nr:DNA methyltransferase [Flavobacterium anhuiense]SCY49789.1 Eco57I restriction-modification methylase [Flavobacterium anhuiense]
MDKKIIDYLNNCTHQETNINKILVSAFLHTNEITKVKNIFISNFIIDSNESKEYEQLLNFVNLYKHPISIEQLLNIFEFVISPEDKKVNGAVFTPLYIREYIITQCLNKYLTFEKKITDVKFGDIACGCGGFFKTIVDIIKLRTDKSYYDIFKDNIFGVDIQYYSIERTKILLILHAIINGEDRTNFDFNLYQGNSLSFNWSLISEIQQNGGFDIIVGNPPYVGASKIDSDTKLLLKKWSVSDSGKSDLYIPFFEIGLENLHHKGILGYITVNTFYKSLNGRSVRNYFSTNKFDLSIIDFGGEQIFKKRSTYTCICIIGKKQTDCINYIKSKSTNIKSITESDYINISYSDLNDVEGWYLVDKRTREIISNIEKNGRPLGKKYEIRNGFATLKNNIYLFTPIKETEEFFFFIKDNKEYKIEKSICRNAIKPNTLKLESEIAKHTEKLIFPYDISIESNDLNKKKLNIIEKKTLKSNYPLTYKYLLNYKKILSERDKGNRDYEEWYAFGRNQALLISGYKLLLPYITNAPCFVYTDDQDLLFYNGYAIFSDLSDDLNILQKILMSKVFWFYITNTSKPYSGNYFSVAKNYIKNFGLFEMTDEEKKFLLNLEDKNDIENFILKKYNLKRKDILF